MKTKPKQRNSAGKCADENVKTKPRKSSLHPICQHRRSAFKFSCGINDPHAALVEESLDERERRG
jgi:hypothetical protein